MSQQKHQMNSQDMLMIHDLAEQSQIKNAYGNVAANDIEEQDGIKIYLRAVDKIEEHFNSIKANFNDLERLKRQRKGHEVAALDVKITLSILDAQKIISEFIRGFSVVHDEAAKDFMILFLSRFNFLDENLQLFQMNKRKQYLEDSLEMLGRIKKTFEKMLDISQQTQETPKTEATKVESSELSV